MYLYKALETVAVICWWENVMCTVAVMKIVLELRLPALCALKTGTCIYVLYTNWLLFVFGARNNLLCNNYTIHYFSSLGMECLSSEDIFRTSLPPCTCPNPDLLCVQTDNSKFLSMYMYLLCTCSLLICRALCSLLSTDQIPHDYSMVIQFFQRAQNSSLHKWCFMAVLETSLYFMWSKKYIATSIRYT